MSRRPVGASAPPTASPSPDPGTTHLFLNRELSWLSFNERVLAEACDAGVPLGERFKFQNIVASNLDEFFMVRVAGLKQLVAGGVMEKGADGMLPTEQLAAICSRAHVMVTELYRNWQHEIAPGLAERAGIAILRSGQLGAEQRSFLEGRFRKDVWPVLTPLAVDQGHPFPMLRNRSLNLAVLLHKERQRVARRHAIFAVVQVPSVLPRLVEVPAPAPYRAAFVLLEDLITMHVGDLFPGFRVVGCSPFRVTRNFDLAIDEDEADDLLKTIQKELRRLERGQAVRLEMAANAPADVEGFLRQSLRLEADDVYAVDGPLHLADLAPLYGHDELRELKDEPFAPQLVPPLADAPNLFRAIGERDVLLHHPYESFDHVVDFISEAAGDPQVLALKQTLYRTSADSPIIRALIRAAENGKQVTAVVELKARFDEGPNIAWARVLEEAGVHVVYGVVGLKTHCKMSLVVRREAGEIKRYVHMSTGNYNPSTARLYGDISFFTAREAFADDAGALFNLLTGYASPPSWKRFSVAPVGLIERVVELIERERGFGAKGRIIAKMNALVDPEVIAALYAASQAGVRVDLLVRGICCLRPGVPGISENIRVTSVIDRFLEHARIVCFDNGGRREVYLSSADWMPRNFVRRVEVMFPIEDEALRNRLVDEILALSMADKVKAHQLLRDGSYERLRPPPDQPEAALRSQQRFVQLARERAHAAEAHATSAGAPTTGYRAPTVPKARAPAPEPVWLLGSPGAPTGGDRLAS
jgi:polyphosphate kinase